MNKGYNIKIYDIQGNFITTINKPLSKFSFSNSINSGVDTITIDTAEHTDSTKFDNAGIVEIIEYSDKGEYNIFAGYVQSKPGIINESQDTIGLECVGLQYLLSEFLFSSGRYAFNKTDTLENILTELVTSFNASRQRNPTNYNGFIGTELIKLDTMPAVDINIDFENNTCLESIIKCFEGAGFDFYISPDGTLKAKEKPTTATHRLTLRKDVQSLDIKIEDKSDLKNSIIVERSGGVVKTYEDATSISSYDKKQIYISKTDIGNETTQDQFGNTYLEDNKDPKREITIEVNTRYPIGSIEPGDTIKVLNTDLDIDNLKILKTSYNGDSMTLNVDKYVSLGMLLTK